MISLRLFSWHMANSPIDAMIKVYHNNRCSKSRNALQYLDSKGIEYGVIYYMEGVLTEELVVSLLKKLHLSAADVLRKGEETYKELIKGKDLSESDLIRLMVAHPNLIERPIVVNGNQAVIARPTEAIDKIL